MCCALALLLSGAPRLATIWLWLFTDRTTIAFDSGIVAVLGWLLLPWTTLMWILAYAPFAGVSGFGYILVIFGLFLDFSAYGGGGKAQRDRGAVAA